MLELCPHRLLWDDLYGNTDRNRIRRRAVRIVTSCKDKVSIHTSFDVVGLSSG